MTVLLSLNQVNACYGSAHILHDLSLHGKAGERVALIGRNGVGKTTVVNTILGLARLTQGEIEVDGTRLTRPRTYQAAQHGVTVVPQGRRIVANLSVEENLILGAKGLGTWLRFTRYFRFCKSAPTPRAPLCRAVSNKCWRWAAP